MSTLSQRQLLTIRHLLETGNYRTPMHIIEYCAIKISQPHADKRGRVGRRKRGRAYYQGILDYFAQGNPIPEL